MRNRIMDHSFIQAVFKTQYNPPDGRMGEEASNWIKKRIIKF